MANKTCDKCGHIFGSPSLLLNHLKRKTPCDKQIIKSFKCKHCNLLFSSSTSMYRHIRKSCNMVKFEEIQKKQLQEHNDIQILQLQILALNTKIDTLNIQPQQPIQQPIIQPIQQPIIQPIPIIQPLPQTAYIQNIETAYMQNIETAYMQNIETQNNINVNLHLCQFNQPYTNIEDVLNTFLDKKSIANKYSLIPEKDDLSIEEENNLIAEIIIEITKKIQTNPNSCNIASTDMENQISVFIDNKWHHISLDNGIREMSDKTIKLIHKSYFVLPERKLFTKLPTDTQELINQALDRIPETYRDQKDSIRLITKPEFMHIFDVNKINYII